MQCTICSTRIAGKTRNNKWSRDFLLCSECFRKKERKEFCPICKQFWNYKSGQADYAMIECTACRMWIHRICDYHLTEEVFDNFEAGLNTEYNCMLCRQEKRKNYISKIINIAEKEDKLGWFREPYEQEEYKRIIKNPMYFSKMRENVDEYLIDVDSMKNHFNLVFTNAFNYNKPKDRVYKDAERVQEIVNSLLKRKWDKLIEKQDMSIEEQEHQVWVQKQISKDADFLDKSEDVVVPPKKFQYVKQRAKQEIEDTPLAKSISDASDNDSSVVNSKLRKRKRNAIYTEDDNYSLFPLENKNSIGRPAADAKSVSKKESLSSKNKRNPEMYFSSDEEMKDIKDIKIDEIDFTMNTNNGKHSLIHLN